MTSERRDHDELIRLFQAAGGETLGDDEVERLRAILTESAEARQLWFLYQDVELGLVGWALAEQELAPIQELARIMRKAPDGGSSVRRSWRTWLPWTIAAAALALASTLVLNALRITRPSSVQPQPVLAEPTYDSVAVLMQASRAEWEETGVPLRIGAPLPRGRLKLKSGLARVEFYCGATIILEGPADFELLAVNRAFCRRGKLRAHVPPQARGFTVGSPRLDLVDLGTEFGMQVGEADRIDVHVFDGAVEIHKPGLDREAWPATRLTTGGGLRIDGTGVTRPASADPKTFVSAEELSRRSEAEARQRQGDWRAASEAWSRVPGLLAYYPFDEDRSWDRTLHDRAAGRRDPTDGTVIGCRRGDGRWPGKGGLEFRGVGDRRIQVPGEHDSLTLMAWVRIDVLENAFNSLVMSDGEAVGGVHWQIRRDGLITLGVRERADGPFVNYRSPVVFRRDEMGQWTHLATVYDRAGREVTHYVDGRAVGGGRIWPGVPLRIGDAEIGNWSPPAFRESRPVRNFNGIIDELIIFSRPLTSAEVGRHHAMGIPRA